MNIRLFFFGKNKPSYIEEGVRDFSKRMGPYCQLEIVYLKDERVHEDVPKVLSQEAQTLLKQLHPDELLVVCDEKGKLFSSEELAKQTENWENEGHHKLAIVVGSAHGLAPEIKGKAVLRLSLSPLTMNHQVVRLVLLEQLYRVFTIRRGMKYHK